jgi:hypothetical protein
MTTPIKINKPMLKGYNERLLNLKINKNQLWHERMYDFDE